MITKKMAGVNMDKDTWPGLWDIIDIENEKAGKKVWNQSNIIDLACKRLIADYKEKKTLI